MKSIELMNEINFTKIFQRLKFVSTIPFSNQLIFKTNNRGIFVKNREISSRKMSRLTLSSLRREDSDTASIETPPMLENKIMELKYDTTYQSLNNLWLKVEGLLKKVAGKKIFFTFSYISL